MPKALTISPNDKTFPDYLDFDQLRIAGRDHIARLSGDIWSDHNVHDPGITIMEVLVYAILDIGYRNQLEDKELFALDNAGGQKEDNFFTAAQILSCNPLTINDFRKLILDVNGVRNAWLEVSDEVEVALGVDGEKSRLRYMDLFAAGSGKEDFLPLRLNGLYKVYLELEPREILEMANLLEDGPDAVVDAVKCILWEHRNLCEDFVEVIVLEEEEVAVCAEFELSSNASPDDVMVEVLQVIDNFLSPTINYYTLQQLLAKGKSMDEIFEGRPLKLESNGFIDTEELEQFDRIREIRTSDLYREIMKIDGVRGIKKLALQSFVNGQDPSGLEKWCLKIGNDRKPVLSTDKLDFTFFKDVLPFFPDKRSVIDRFKKRLINVRKATLQPYELDFDPPLGRYRDDLETYRSIQHDFPLVYGIGEGHLSATAPASRKAQAMQLKGYLLFFDQLLANYLSQLANIRRLFSVEPESMRLPEDKRTYFAQRLRDVPKVEELIRFYEESDQREERAESMAFWLGELADLEVSTQQILSELGLSNEKEKKFLELYPEIRDQFLQLPSKKMEPFQQLSYSSGKRNVLLLESIRDFQNEYIESEVVEYIKSGEFFFLIKDKFGQPFLKSKNTYPNAEAAAAAAKELEVFGILKEAYRAFGKKMGDRRVYTFEILNNPLDYWTYLNKILESEAEYLKRRDIFLDHLLARFSEHFTDYVLLMFALNGQKHDLETIVREKSNFLHHYPEISRNRGKGYNYSDKTATWNTDNISGFEKRVTSMLGIADFQRQHLSHFQVVEKSEIYYYRLYHQGVAVFVSRRGYPDEAAARQALTAIYNLSKSADKYEVINCQFNGAYTFKLVGSNNNVAIHPGTYPSPEVRDKVIEMLAADLTLNIYEPVTTVDPTILAGKPEPPGASTNPPGSTTNPPTGFTPTSGGSSTSTNPPGFGPVTGTGSSGSSTNPPGAEETPETAPELTPVTPPYTCTGNIFVKIKIGTCETLAPDSIYQYRVMDEEDICLRYPGTFPAADYEAYRAYLSGKLPNIHKQYTTLALGESKVVIELDGKYHFQLVTQEKSEVLWRSCATFAGSDEAHEAFKRDFFELVELAREEENYREQEVDEEIRVFLTRAEDEPALAEIPPEELKAGKVKAKIKRRRIHALRYPVVRKEEPEEPDETEKKLCRRSVESEAAEEEQERFGFWLIELDKSLRVEEPPDWVSAKDFDNPVDAWFGFINCLELLSNEDNWLKTGNERTGEVSIAVGEVLLESECSYLSEHDAWEGTKNFADHSREDLSFRTYVDFWSDCCCNFHVLGNDYRLAVHPYHYNSPEEREVISDCLRRSARERERFFSLVRPEIGQAFATNPNAPECYAYFIVSEAEEYLWQGYRSFTSVTSARQVYEEQHIAILNLARAAENYHFVPVPDGCRVVLRNEHDEIVAMIPETFDAADGEGRLREIVKRIRLARQFPIKISGSGFKFDIYDPRFDRNALLEKAWDVIQGKTDEEYCPSPPQALQVGLDVPNGCDQDEKLYLVHRAEELVGGGVVLESLRVFGSRKEMDFIIRWLQDHQYLFRQHDSYQPTQTANQGPYSLEWVNPAGVLAVSPRRYLLTADCSAALEHTRVKVNAEGLHLLEHLLLRPLTVPSKYVLEVTDADQQVLVYGLTQYEDEDAASNDKSSFIARVKVAAESIYRRLENDQVPVRERQQRLRLRDANKYGDLIAVGCRPARGEAAFRAQIECLCNLQAENVRPVLFRDKNCDETLLEICIDPKDIVSQSVSEPIERCGDLIQGEENFYDSYIHGADPYSFWVSIVVPYWPARFQNTNFRTFFANTIRRELPAYVAPRILWVNPRDMKQFEKAYRAWLRAKSVVVAEQTKLGTEAVAAPVDNCLDLQLEPAGDGSDLKAALQELTRAQTALTQVLFGLTNEYPVARLEDFKFSSGSNIVLLNQTKLG